MDSKNIVYHETKLHVYTITFVFFAIVVYFMGVRGGVYMIPLLVGVFFYSRAKITVGKEYFGYEKGKKRVTLPWGEVTGVLRDSLADGLSTGGFSVQTARGNTDSIGAVKRAWEYCRLKEGNCWMKY